MFSITDENKNIIKFVIIILCLLAGIVFVKVFQTSAKTERIYKQALKDYQNQNYQNAYYLFSRISPIAKLKPAAMYRQALCAKALGDKHSELKIYRMFLQKYPMSKLTPEIKYEAGQLMAETSGKSASRYFKDVVHSSNISEDYKVASKYYLAKISAANIKYSSNKIYYEKKEKIEDAFREYLEKYPDGRLAPKVASDWIKFNPELNSGDRILTAMAYSIAGHSDKSKELLQDTDDKNSWAVKALNAYAFKDYANGNSLVEMGVANPSVNIADYKRAVDEYVKVDGNSANKLLSFASGSGKDYIWDLACEEAVQKGKCYSDLYANFPDGEYAQNALLNVFADLVIKKQYASAKKVGQDYLLKYPEESKNAPYVLFWLGKISQKYDTSEFVKYYQDVINNYPDTYYAYRAFWILKGISSPLIKANLNIKPVIYPYKFPMKGSILYSLIKVNDYDLLTKFVNDEFIKSWAEYQKGNYSVSSHIAQQAMEKIKEKPLKSDIRWRLVYPLNYYKQILANSQDEVTQALIMAIIREESYFNMNAQSDAGAIGLMQLMPSTAHEIGEKYGISFSNMGLFNPELNIKLGSMYYSSLRNMFNNNDIYSVASYNGGSGAVNNWETQLKYSDIDEFVEQIPYEETKNYIKKVFKSYWNYIRIYQD